MRWRFALVGTLSVLVLLPATPASAHAELGPATPTPGARLTVVPDQLRLGFSESLAPDSRIRVMDGCSHPAEKAASVTGNQMVVSLVVGRPGTWRVSYDVISADDGHPSSGSYAFTVLGAPRCQDAAAPLTLPGGGTGREQSQLLLPALLGIVAMLGAAFVVRRSTASAR